MEMSLKTIRNAVAITFLLLLTLVILVDSFLIVWILTSGGFFKDGSGLNIQAINFWTSGNLFAFKSIFIDKIHSRSSETLRVLSDQEIHLQTPQTSVNLRPDGLDINSPTFEIRNPEYAGMTVFKVTEKEAIISSRNIQLSGKGGLKLRGKIQSQKVYSGPGNKLGLSSSTDKVILKGPKGVYAKSFSGNITFSAFNDLYFQTKNHGKITFESGSLYLTALKASNSSRSRNPTSSKNSSKSATNAYAYQLCSCRDGKIFVSQPQKNCVADYHICSI